jgi:TonB family protein
MKSLLSLGLIALALSFCSLLGKRNNNNSNGNARPGTVTESNANENSNRPELTSAPPPPESIRPQQRNSNAGVPQMENPSLTAPIPKPSPKIPKAPISGGVLNGKAIKLVQPSYPAIARAAHASGQVTVQVIIDEQGNVISATPVSGHPLLQGAAVAAARASKFTPTTLSGVPVKVSGVLIYHFVEK